MDSHCKHIKAMHIRESREEFEQNLIFDIFFRNKENDWIYLDDIMAIFPGVGHIQYYAHNKDVSFIEVILKDLLPLFEKQYGLNHNDDDNKDDDKIKDREYPQIVISVDPEIGEDALKIIIEEYERKFEIIGWQLHCYRDRVKDQVAEIIKQHLAKNPIAKSMGFTEEVLEIIPNILENEESGNIVAELVRNGFEQYVETMNILCGKYDVNKSLAVCLKEAQKSGFEMSKDWHKLESLCLQISPIDICWRH